MRIVNRKITPVILEQLAEQDVSGRPKSCVMVERMIGIALHGKDKEAMQAIEWLVSYTDGKAVNTNINADITENPFDGIDSAKIEALKAKLTECYPK